MGQENGSQARNVPAVDAHLIAAMQSLQGDDKDIDILEYLKLLWNRKWIIIAIVSVAAVITAGYSLTLPNLYTADVVITSVGEKQDKQKSFGRLGGLASMAGIALNTGGDDVELNLAVLKSREFLWRVAKERNLKPLLIDEEWDEENKRWREEEPSDWKVYGELYKMISVSQSKKSSVIRMYVEWKDPVLAADLANDLVARLNEHLRKEALQRSQKTLMYLNNELAKIKIEEMRQTLFSLISQEQNRAMVASTQKEFAFRVLDPAVPPFMKSNPKRSRMVILAALLSSILSVVGVLIWNAIQLRMRHEDRSANVDS